MREKIKDISKLHLKIGGMSCSFCVETIKKAYRKQKGVENVNVSLSHELKSTVMGRAMPVCRSNENSSLILHIEIHLK